MDYFCEVCDIFNKAKSKYKHFKSNIHKDFDKCEQILLLSKGIDKNNENEAFYLYNSEHNKKLEYYLVKYQFKLTFKDHQFHI